MRPLATKLLVGSFLVFLLLPSIINVIPVHATSPTKVTIGPNIDISNAAGDQDETSIAINPNNPSQIVASSGDNSGGIGRVRAYFSSDGGATWGSTFLPVPPPVNGSKSVAEFDPGVAWDTLGNVYISHFVWFGTSNIGSEIAVDRSSDGGRTWASTYFTSAKGSGLFNDKPMIAVDTNPTSPFHNSIYVAWDLDPLVFHANTTFILQLSRSTDHGVTFSSPISPAMQPGGGSTNPVEPMEANPFIGPDGTLYIAWFDPARSQIALSSSTDGGLTFGAANVIGSATAGLSSSVLWLSVPAVGTKGAMVYPACGADTSAGQNRGTLYCSWIDETATSGVDVFEAHSTDHGQTWSQRVRVNDDPTGLANDQFGQWLSVDPTDGRVSMSWYDTRNDPTHLSTNVFYASSTDGGLTFTPNVQVTTASTIDPCRCVFGGLYGDYQGIAAFGGVVHPVWTDMRASVASLDQEIFTATITIKGPANQSQIPTPLTPNMILLATLLGSISLALFTRKRR